jgi:hypothetical protein
MPDGLPSLEFVSQRTTEERRAIAAHADALDAKAGIALGFAGAFVALLVPRAAALFRVATAFGAVAAVLAMAAFFPRSFPVLGIEALRDKYLGSDERFTRLAVLDAEIELRERSRTLIRFKTWLVRSTIVALALAIVCAVAGSIVD